MAQNDQVIDIKIPKMYNLYYLRPVGLFNIKALLFGIFSKSKILSTFLRPYEFPHRKPLMIFLKNGYFP